MNLSLSIEDTNKLRRQVGLKPIPIPGKKSGGEGEKSDVKVEQFSVDGTNEFRRRLGLKLIPSGESVDAEGANYLRLKERETQTRKAENVQLDLQQAKNDLKNRQRMARGGILDRLEKKGGLQDFDSWLDKVGKEVKRGAGKKLSFKSSRKTARTEKAVDRAEQPSKEGSGQPAGEILTAKDVSVLDDEENEEFENRELERENELKKTLQSRKDRGKLVTLDAADDAPDALLNEDHEEKQSNLKKRKLEYLDLESEDSDSDNADYNEKEKDDKNIERLFKRDVSKFKKSKKAKHNDQSRKRVFDKELEDRKFGAVVLEDDNDVADELDQFLNSTISSQQRKREIDYAVEDDAENNNRGEVINENLEFLDKIRVQNDPEASGKKFEARVVEQGSKVEAKGLEESRTTARYKALLEAEANKNYNTYGVSSILNALKSGSQKPSNGEKSDDRVNIVYTDDDGNILNTKEAFKYLSHKFHGSKKK